MKFSNHTEGSSAENCWSRHSPLTAEYSERHPWAQGAKGKIDKRGKVHFPMHKSELGSLLSSGSTLRLVTVTLTPPPRKREAMKNALKPDCCWGKTRCASRGQSHNMGQKNLDMIWVNFISGPDWETVLECEAVMLHGQKSKIGEVFAQVWR